MKLREPIAIVLGIGIALAWIGEAVAPGFFTEDYYDKPIECEREMYTRERLRECLFRAGE